MSGILKLESLTKGNTLKQGDKTPLKYRLLDADGDLLSIAGKSAEVRLVYPDFLTIGYKKDGLTVAQDDTVTFTIDQAIPARIYHVEIIVDNKFVFPSRVHGAKLTVDKSSLGADTNIIEIVGKDVLIQEVKSQVDTELQPLVTSLESIQQTESNRVSAEEQREIDHANRSAELASKADKVVIKNEIENGDFSDGTTGWIQSGYFSRFEVIDGVAKTTDFTSANRSFRQTLSGQYSIGDIMYVSIRTRIDHPDKFRDMYVLSDLTASADTIIVGSVTNMGTEFTQLSGVIRYNGNFRLRVLYNFTETGEYPAYLKDVVTINLTQTFGAGNEPSKEEMDELVKIIGYIDDEYALNNKEMLIWTLALIRRNKNAIVALGGT